jgi:glycerate 2-kinase
VLTAALDAVDPAAAVRAALDRDEERLAVTGRAVPLAGVERVIVLGMGKAVVGMARGLLEVIQGVSVSGALAVPAPADLGSIETLVGEHPEPGTGSLAAGTRLLELAASARRSDLVVFLLSGGGSSLAEVPAAGLTIADLSAVTSRLLSAGVSINGLNTVRKHLSALKGGRLGAAASGAGASITLILSDVVGDPTDVIASGPTVPDPSTYLDALAVVEGRGVSVPAVMAHLVEGAAGRRPETPVGEDEVVRQVIEIVGSGATAARAAVASARSHGIEAGLAGTDLTGSATQVAARLVEDGRALRRNGMRVFAGESTVDVRGEGRGGRNQEVALAAALLLDGDDDLAVASLGTDGVDGPTAAAGGIADGGTVSRGRRLGLSAPDHLLRNDSYPYLLATGDLLVTGPTGTNVGDLMVVWRVSNG